VTTGEFFAQLDACIARHDLLCHPYYQAWSAGQLTREDLREYAENYYHHVEAFPGYLAALAIRLEDGELRRAVLANMCDEKGAESEGAAPHAELWLDFAEGMGASREGLRHQPMAEVRDLMMLFHSLASEGAPEEALAAFYAYEAQVPRIAGEKARGLREIYGADEKSCAYSTLHTTADVYHSGVWREQLAQRLKQNPALAGKALQAAEKSAQALWRVLDGMESRRTSLAASV
jgi:pyrroloquinoline-quinone synthase